MDHEFDIDGITATDMRIALNDFFPDTTYGAVPVVDHYDAVEAYLAFDDGALAEAPQALAADVSHHQYSAV